MRIAWECEMRLETKLPKNRVIDLEISYAWRGRLAGLERFETVHACLKKQSVAHDDGINVWERDIGKNLRVCGCSVLR